MFNKWFNQDINNFLSKRNRVVVVDESTHLDLLQKVPPTEYKVFVVNNAIEKLPAGQGRSIDAHTLFGDNYLVRFDDNYLVRLTDM